MRKYHCPNCDHDFTDSSAFCLDHNAPETRFGCPACKVFFKKSYKLVSVRNLILSIFGGLIAGTISALVFTHFGINGGALSGGVTGLVIGVAAAINTKLDLVVISSSI